MSAIPQTAKLITSRPIRIKPASRPAPLRKVSSATRWTFHSPIAKPALASDAWTSSRGGGIIGSKRQPGKAGYFGQGLGKSLKSAPDRSAIGRGRGREEASRRGQLEDERPWRLLGRAEGVQGPPGAKSRARG